ncbi:predicted protein [Nematostella vectensis]|uniref:DED domain-containing protein n=1 Tax=Nematostella vectensis TaxID=45351 RepID=A7SRY8_NEMVE|nr:predicted protein [Nematostella vectensis]|eukprot:XP_001625623.1 predicted protein [Nematostella vectensis]
MAQVRKLLNSIGQELTKENITALKHECADVIPAGRAEEISTPFQLYEELIRMDKLGDDNLEYLGERLRSIGRQDLKDKLLETSGRNMFHDLQPLKFYEESIFDINTFDLSKAQCLKV